jgi:hypothetical protein
VTQAGHKYFLMGHVVTASVGVFEGSGKLFKASIGLDNKEFFSP